MAVNKGTKVTPAVVPIHNINQFIRVPGNPPTALSQALQNWEGINTQVFRISDPETPQEFRFTYNLVFTNETGQYRIPVNEQIYEVALYTGASRRFADWMKANREKVQANA